MAGTLLAEVAEERAYEGLHLIADSFSLAIPESRFRRQRARAASTGSTDVLDSVFTPRRRAAGRSIAADAAPSPLSSARCGTRPIRRGGAPAARSRRRTRAACADLLGDVRQQTRECPLFRQKKG